MEISDDILSVIEDMRAQSFQHGVHSGFSQAAKELKNCAMKAFLDDKDDLAKLYRDMSYTLEGKRAELEREYAKNSPMRNRDPYEELAALIEKEIKP